MPFGLITKAQLDARTEELREEIARSVAFEEELKLEWANWYGKFRSLYMRLVKAEKKAEQPEPEPEPGGPEVPAQVVIVHPKRFLRGF